MPRDELDRLLPEFELVPFVANEMLQPANEAVERVHFIESGLISCFAGEGGRERTEVAVIGREGMTGHSVALGVDRIPFRKVAQRAGVALTVSTASFRALCKESEALRAITLRYAQVFTTQVAETGRANARQTVEARLARWLLMAHDRIDGDEIGLTHENLSQMLGVRRPGITVSLHVLEGEHMIRARRGAIQILDRDKLMGAAQGSYGLPEAEYRRLIG